MTSKTKSKLEVLSIDGQIESYTQLADKKFGVMLGLTSATELEQQLPSSATIEASDQYDLTVHDERPDRLITT